MRRLLGIAILVASLSDRAALAETVGLAKPAPVSAAVDDTASQTQPQYKQDKLVVGQAPIGHRQPHVSDLPSESASNLERITDEDLAVDRKLNICRGC